MTLFALVHGGWHGAWCWDLVKGELEARGHRTVALDMPIESGPIGTYIDPVVDMVEGARGDDDVVLVAHSMGGMVVPYVADRTTVDHLVYLCALMPRPGATITETFQTEGFIRTELFGDTVNNDDGTVAWTIEGAMKWFFHDCPDDAARAAAEKLRPQYMGFENDPPPIDVGRFPSTYILCRGDRVVPPDWSRQRAKDWLGAEAIEMDGSHSPFLSRPKELTDLLVSIA